MSGIKSDVLVIGGGTAACVAAASAMEAGKKVTMVFPNGGSSEISGGAIDILGVIPGEKPEICEDYQEGIEAVLKEAPDHVYGKCKDSLESGVKTLVDLAEAGGYPMKGFDGKNVWVPNMLGTFAVNAYVPEAMADGIVEPGKEARILVIGIKGNVTFNAKAAAMSYQKYQEKLGGKATYFSTEIHLTGWGDRRKISDGELADYLDTTEGKEELLTLIKTFCMNNRYAFDTILFPPVLGYLKTQSIVAELKEVCGCKIAEVQALGNSVVGYRFTRAIYRALEAKGVQMLKGSKVAKIEAVDQKVEADCVVGLTDQLHPGEGVEIEAAAAVLATGGYIGGGIKARKTEVWIELLDQNLGTLTTDQLTRDAIAPKGQQFMQLGVEVNEDLSVKEETWKGRLFACGDVLAGHNFANERSGAGIAAASAYLAGKHAAAV
nr:FAD-binding protein [uncultured Mediterraneibacter sp.]